MKKQLLMVLAISASLSTFAQNRTPRPRIHLDPNAKAIPIRQAQGGINEAPINTNASMNNLAPVSAARTSSSVTETLIGKTTYDLQTNSAILNRLLKHNDGTMSAEWTMIPPNGASGDRGSGYNYYDGTSWGPVPTARIQPVNRTGFANIVVTASGRELDISHSSTAPGMLITARPTKGTGAWVEDATVLGGVGADTWAKAIAGGANGETVHALWNANAAGDNGQEFSVYYSRSLDGGVTWPILRTVLPDIDSTKYIGFGGDAYSMDTDGDTVVFVIGDFDTDLLLVRSNDNGTTWTSTVIQPFFQSFYDDLVDSFPDLDGDGTSDRMEGPSGDAHVMIDNLGKVHVWWTNVLMTDTSASDEIGYFPNSLDGLLYWNDGFLPGAAPDTIAFAEDMDGNGTLDIQPSGPNNGNGMGVYRGSVTQMPTSGVDASNNLYVSYQTYCEACDTTAFTNTGHKHVYVIASTDQGASWTDPVDVDQTADLLNQEDVFACMAKKVDANVHIIYQRDGAPGHSLSANATEAGWNTLLPSDIIYASIPTTDLITNVKSVKVTNSFGLSQNSPNPSNGLTNIGFTVSSNQSKVVFEVTDVLGNVVYSEDKGSLNAGIYNISLNTETLSGGVYFYSVKINNQKETKKMMVK